MENQKNNSTGNNTRMNNNRPAGNNGRGFFRRPAQTRILRNDNLATGGSAANTASSGGTPSVSGPAAIATTNAQGHRIVLGKAARRAMANGNRPTHPNAPRPQHGGHPTHGGHSMNSSRSTHNAPNATPRMSTKPHIAGARMDIVRKVGKMMPRRQNKAADAQKRDGDIIPPLAPRTIRIVPLGGVEEVGKNMTAIEYGNDIIIIDMGFQFREEGTPGLDYILPNTKYVEERASKVRGVFITHGHLDHIGGIPYIMPRIGNPPMYTRQFGAIMIQKRQEEFPQVPPIDLKIVDKNETIVISPEFKVETFAISHTMPDS